VGKGSSIIEYGRGKKLEILVRRKQKIKEGKASP